MVSLDIPSLDESITRKKCLKVLMLMKPKRFGFQNLIYVPIADILGRKRLGIKLVPR